MGEFMRTQFSADYIISTFGFDLRQGQGNVEKRPAPWRLEPKFLAIRLHSLPSRRTKLGSISTTLCQRDRVYGSDRRVVASGCPGSFEVRMTARHMMTSPPTRLPLPGTRSQKPSSACRLPADRTPQPRGRLNSAAHEMQHNPAKRIRAFAAWDISHCCRNSCQFAGITVRLLVAWFAG